MARLGNCHELWLLGQGLEIATHFDSWSKAWKLPSSIELELFKENLNLKTFLTIFKNDFLNFSRFLGVIFSHKNQWDLKEFTFFTRKNVSLMENMCDWILGVELLFIYASLEKCIPPVFFHTKKRNHQKNQKFRAQLSSLSFAAYIVKAGEFCLVLKAREWQCGFSPI